MNDKNSEVSKLFKNERSYVLLEEYNVQPSVAYMTKVRNVDDAIAGSHAEEHSKEGKHEDKKEEAAVEHHS
jgi:molybdopterin-containing oxidoreductase family iron-sulfur binding subunit